jgi:hypothetical protein
VYAFSLDYDLYTSMNIEQFPQAEQEDITDTNNAAEGGMSSEGAVEFGFAESAQIEEAVMLAEIENNREQEQRGVLQNLNTWRKKARPLFGALALSTLVAGWDANKAAAEDMHIGSMTRNVEFSQEIKENAPPTHKFMGGIYERGVKEKQKIEKLKKLLEGKRNLDRVLYRANTTFTNSIQMEYDAFIVTERLGQKPFTAFDEQGVDRNERLDTAVKLNASIDSFTDKYLGDDDGTLSEVEKAKFSSNLGLSKLKAEIDKWINSLKFEEERRANQPLKSDLLKHTPDQAEDNKGNVYEGPQNDDRAL